MENILPELDLDTDFPELENLDKLQNGLNETEDEDEDEAEQIRDNKQEEKEINGHRDGDEEENDDDESVKNDFFYLQDEDEMEEELDDEEEKGDKDKRKNQAQAVEADDEEDLELRGFEEDDEDDGQNEAQEQGLGFEEDEEQDNELDDLDATNDYLQKFKNKVTRSELLDYHPECHFPSMHELTALATVVRDAAKNRIVDPLHTTTPIMTKYEMANIIGVRSHQIETGSPPMVKVPEGLVIDGKLIAKMELQQKKIPFILRRPLSNGTFEYWHVRDLMNLNDV
jgi:DNA-directed RNA polymerase I, II, and III subunit RPABC2